MKYLTRDSVACMKSKFYNVWSGSIAVTALLYYFNPLITIVPVAGYRQIVQTQFRRNPLITMVPVAGYRQIVQTQFRRHKV